MTIKIECHPTFSEEQLNGLVAGDAVEISGEVITIRDASAKKFASILERGDPMPIDLKGRLLYACGPSPPKPGQIVGSAGPTTTERFTKYLPYLFRAGARGIIGKGELRGPILDAFREHRAAYFAAIGGIGASLGKVVEEAEIIGFSEMGSEALYRFVVRSLPAVLIIDNVGNNFHETARNAWRRR